MKLSCGNENSVSNGQSEQQVRWPELNIRAAVFDQIEQRLEIRW